MTIAASSKMPAWTCGIADKDGYYSGYTNAGLLGTQNNTAKVFCRGLQYSDANGEVKFTTIYPGWYQGRVTHIHVQVYVGTSLKLTSQMAFPEEFNTEVYNSSIVCCARSKSNKEFYGQHHSVILWTMNSPRL